MRTSICQLLHTGYDLDFLGLKSDAHILDCCWNKGENRRYRKGRSRDFPVPGLSLGGWAFWLWLHCTFYLRTLLLHRGPPYYEIYNTNSENRPLSEIIHAPSQNPKQTRHNSRGNPLSPCLPAFSVNTSWTDDTGILGADSLFRVRHHANLENSPSPKMEIS